MAAGRIFVCYRREDSAGHAGRLYDRLNRRFPDSVFMDVAGISIGIRWAEVIEQTLGSCKVAIVLISKRWLERSPDGTRRIDQPDDSTRAEITTALRLKLKIIPLLVSGAAVPERHDLPADLAALTDWQALHVDDDDFDHDADRLIRALEEALGEERSDARRHTASATQAGIRGPEPQPARPARRSATNAGLAVAGLFVIGLLSSLKSVSEAQPRVTQSAEASPVPASPRETAYAPRAKSDNASAPAQEVSPPARQPPVERAVQPPPVEPQMRGDYALVSLAEGGVSMPASGTMRLIPLRSGVLQFDTFVTVLGISYRYIGYFQGSGASWIATTTQSNDRRALAGTLAFHITFDGSTLTTENPYGQVTVWSKQ